VNSGREKAINLPGVVVALIGAFALIHLWRGSLSPAADADVLARFAFVPGRLTFAFDPEAVTASLNELMRSDMQGARIARFFLGDGSPHWGSLVTYSFLHGDWMHLGFNALWLAAFGSAVARRFGTPRFLAFGLVSVLAGAMAHWLAHRVGLQPVIGASAVVSGAMAAAARFAFSGGVDSPALRFNEMMRNRAAVNFLAIWLVTNFLFGVAGPAMGVSDSPIAWEAHIGGFLVGLFGFGWFDQLRAKPAPQ
jgi:membrane associated rhomboid family serine protease